MIYFIQETGSGRVKIGFSAVPAHRVSKIASDSPYPVVYLGSIDGTREDEMAIHKRLSAHRVHGEWFAAVVVGECRALCAGQTERTYPRTTDPKYRRRNPRTIQDCRTMWDLLNIVGQTKLAAAMGMTRGEFTRWRDRQWWHRGTEYYGFDPTQWERLMDAVPGLSRETLHQIAHGEAEMRAELARERAERERAAA